MECMFSNCSSIENLSVYNFNTENVTNMSFMFNECSSLNDIDITNFNFDKVISMVSMFYGCSDKLINKVRAQSNNLKMEAFEELDLDIIY